MSAPHTNLEKQRRRHWPALLGIAVAALFGVFVIMSWIGEEVATSDPQSPAGTEAGTVDAPAQSTIPAEVIEPHAQPDSSQSPATPPTTRPSPPPANSAGELTTQ